MQRVKVWAPSGALTAREWRRLLDSQAEIIAVLEPDQDELLPALLMQLGEGDFICSYAPVSDALKVVIDGLVVDSIDREDVVELGPPFAFRTQAALPVVDGLDPDQSIDLLQALAAAIEPLVFRR